MRLSWNEIRARAAEFTREWADAAYEKGETQSFYNEFFEIFGVRRRTGARYEEHVRRLAARGGSPHIHMTERTLSLRRGEVIDDEVGMKSAQERLRTSHRSRNRPNGARKRAAGRP